MIKSLIKGHLSKYRDVQMFANSIYIINILHHHHHLNTNKFLREIFWNFSELLSVDLTIVTFQVQV